MFDLFEPIRENRFRGRGAKKLLGIFVFFCDRAKNKVFDLVRIRRTMRRFALLGHIVATDASLLNRCLSKA